METARPDDRDEALDVTLGLGATVVSATRFVFAAARPVVRLALRPPLVPSEITPQAGLDAVARTGRRVRAQFNPLLDRFVPPIAAAVLDRVDINQVVARADIDAVIDRVDIAGVVRQALDEIDLPEIIRESSGSLASESVVGMRMQGIAADERVNRIVDKILLRRAGRQSAPSPVPVRPGSGDDAR
jgi:hypothetical protein